MSDILSQIEEIQGNVRGIKATWGSTIMTLDNIKTALKADRQKAIEEAYQKGYDEAKLIYQNPHAESDYQKGLEYAWDAVRKIAAMPTEVSNPLFGYFGLQNILSNVAPAEAIAKLKAYEEQQKAEQEIKVGDEVIATSGKAVVYGVFTDNDKVLGCRYLYSDGTLGWNSATALTKTGRHFPQITEVLETMKEGAE